MIHEPAIVHESVKLPRSVTVWHFTSIEHSVSVGEDTVIGGRCFIGAGSRIGARVRIQDGCFVPRGTVIEDDVFIGPGVVMTDDRYPSAGQPYDPRPPVLRAGCSIGGGARIAPGVEIGANARVRLAAVVTADIAAESYYRKEAA